MKYYLVELEDYATNNPGRILSRWCYTSREDAEKMFESILDDNEFDITEDGDSRGEGRANEWDDYPVNYKVLWWAHSEECEFHITLSEINMEETDKKSEKK